jgi:alkaline phosphatase
MYWVKYRMKFVDTIYYIDLFFSGLFSHDHMSFEVDRDPEKEPSLIEMTQKAIELLEKSNNGYFLLVEGGLIDHGHHLSQARKALEDFVMFDNAIGKALDMTSTNDTLILVTADHSHTFSLGGNSVRGNDILGIRIFNNKNFKLFN